MDLRGNPINATSRIISPLLIMLALAIAGCGEESGPGQFITEKNPAPPLVIENGVFEVTATVAFNGCNSEALFDGNYSIQIDDSVFTMGTWKGDWDPNTLEGHGESAHSVRTIRQCTINSWTSVDVEFISENEFVGHIVYRYRTTGSCDCCATCQSSWTIKGVRLPD